MKKKDVKKMYNLPNDVKFCKKCVVSNQRPRISFDSKGVCSACNYAQLKNNFINWEDRELQLIDLLNTYRKSDGAFDVVVPSSGGKDSVYVAHQLKYKYNMNPLTVTWAPHLYTSIGWENHQALVNAGLPNILGFPDGSVHRKMTKDSFVEMGEPFQPFIYGQVSFPLQVAVGYNIPLIMDGENGEVEYGGDDNSSQEGFSLEEEIKYWYSGFPIEYWLEKGYTKKELIYYFPPDMDKIIDLNINRKFYSYYKKWSPQEHYYYAVEHSGFKANPDGRSEGTYSKYASLDDRLDGFHFYLMFIKFGIGRATSDASQEVRGKHLSREEAVNLVKRFDGEFPSKYYKEFLEYCNITEEYFWEAIDSWRSEHLWKNDNGKWKLRYQVD